MLPNTGGWLLSDPTFKKWKKDSVSSILWLHGIPGSGKSKLMLVEHSNARRSLLLIFTRSIVVEDVLKDFDLGHSPPPAYFYCSRNPAEPARSKPEAILASIARQLANLKPENPLLEPTVISYKNEEMKGFPSGKLDIRKSCELILQLVEHYPLTTIVIDALDECDPETRFELLEGLERILQDSPNLVKIFVSSRDDQDITLHLQDYPNLEIASNKIEDDIIRFVKNEVHELVQKKKLLRYSSNDDELKELIINKVTEGAVGM